MTSIRDNGNVIFVFCGILVLSFSQYLHLQ